VVAIHLVCKYISYANLLLIHYIEEVVLITARLFQLHLK